MTTAPKPRHALASWLIPAGTFVLGAVLASVMASAPPVTVASAPQEAPMFGASAPASPTALPVNSEAEAQLALMRDINRQFVAQLRRYEERLRAIATDAEAEGAPAAAEAMRDFAFETETIMDRYDSILSRR